MKISIPILLVVSFIAAASSAQTVNGIPIKDIHTQYVQIKGEHKFLTNKITVDIDFGQESHQFKRNKETVIKGDDGKRMEFNSMIDALNFMTSHHYEFVQAYAFANNDSSSSQFLLRKKTD
jgi:hypothetical protein